MKKLIITCALLTAASMVSFAQNTPTGMEPGAAQTAQQPRPMPATPEEMATRRTKVDEKMFNLTPDQMKGVHDIELEFCTANQKFRSEAKQPTKEEMEGIMTKRDQKMKAILTPDQYAKYEVTRSRQRNAPMTPATQAQPGK